MYILIFTHSQRLRCEGGGKRKGEVRAKERFSLLGRLPGAALTRPQMSDALWPSTGDPLPQPLWIFPTPLTWPPFNHPHTHVSM